MNFLLVLTELFSLGVTVEVLRANIERRSAFLLQQGQFGRKFQIEGVASSTNRSSWQKTRMNDLSCGIRMWAQVSFVLSQSTHLTDGQTDRQTDGRTDGRSDGQTNRKAFWQ